MNQSLGGLSPKSLPLRSVLKMTRNHSRKGRWKQHPSREEGAQPGCRCDTAKQGHVSRMLTVAEEGGMQREGEWGREEGLNSLRAGCAQPQKAVLHRE